MPVTHIPVSGRQINAADWAEEHVVDLTDTEVTDALGYVPASSALFSTLAAGLVPTSPGGTTAYLRADGTWATPAGGGGAVAWGAITGTLSSQADLQAALDAKADDSDLAGYATDGELAAGLATKADTSHTHAAADITSGTLAAARMPALTGDVTTSAGAVATTIANGAVSLAKMANMATASLIYRKTAGSGAPEVNTLATLKTDLGLSGTNTGDQTTITGNAGTATALQNSRNFSITGGGITAASVGFNGTANVALNASVDAGHITLARMADIATARFIGRVTAATGVPEALTGTQATTLLDTFTSALKGLVPASGGGTTNFLRADGTWVAPPGGGGGSGSITASGYTQNTARLLGRTTASVGAIEELTNSAAKTFLAIAAADVSGLSALATSTDAANLTGTVAAARMPALTGDVTTTVGTVATSIASGAVSLAKMANVATGTVFYRKTAGTGAPEVQTLATLKTDLNLTGTNSGDQTITLTGNATGSGTGSFAVTVVGASGDFTVTGIHKPQGGILNTGTVLARIENSGGSAPTGAAGVGLEFAIASATDGVIQSYNRTSAAFAPLRLTGSTLDFLTGAAIRLSISAAGVSTFSQNVIASTGLGVGSAPYGILGVEVDGSAYSPGGSWPADVALFGPDPSINNGSCLAISHDATLGTRFISLQPGTAWRPHSVYSSTFKIFGNGVENFSMTTAGVATFTGNISAPNLGTASAKNMHVGTTAPGSPATGDLWVDTN